MIAAIKPDVRQLIDLSIVALSSSQATTMLDDTSWIAPVAQIWLSSAQPWAVAHGIFDYDEQPTDPGPMLAAWKAKRASAGG